MKQDFINTSAFHPGLRSEELDALQRIDEMNKELRERNEARIAAMKEAMGRKYILHPANGPTHVPYRSVLNSKDEDHGPETQI